MDPVTKVEYHAIVVSMVLNTIALNPVKRSVEKRSGVVWSHQKNFRNFEILAGAPENKNLKKRVWAKITFFS